MKILMLTPYLPFPLFSGGQTRSYNLLKNLSGKHEITLFSFIREDAERKHIRELEKFCKKVVVFKRRKAWSPVNLALAAITPYPFLVSIYFSQALNSRIRQELSQENYDLIHAETFYVMPNIPKTNLPIILVEQTIEYLVYKHFVEAYPNPLLRLPLWIDVAKIRFWETYFWKRAERVIAMSEADKKVMKRLVSGLEVEIVPNGVDVSHFSQKTKKKSQNPTILYVGGFRWLQNREAFEVLVSQLWPKVKDKVGSAHLLIVGQGQTEQMRRLAARHQDVFLDESVRDIRDAYSRADLMLAPIKGPGGTRLKILEAMASGVPVVTTSVGIEGLEAKDSTHVVIRDTQTGLVKSAIRLLKDEGLKDKVAGNAKKLVAEKYGWEQSAKALDKIYREAAYGKKT